MNGEDTLEITGLAPILDEGPDPPYLDLHLRCNGQAYRAAILIAGEEWAVRVHDEWGKSCTEDADLYATQADAILVAMMIALDHSRGIVPAPVLSQYSEDPRQRR